MKGHRKKFEPVEYAVFDTPAKLAVGAHLTAVGHVVTVPPEDYGPDLYSNWANRKMYHEVEVSTNWLADEFPFDSTSTPERKYRLLAKCNGHDLFFWRLRIELKRAIVTPARYLCDEYLVEVPNRKISNGEYFYRVPITLCKEFDLCL